MRINYWAVGVAALIHFMMGAVWFTILMNPWLAGIEKTQEQLMRESSPWMPYVIGFVGNLIMAYFLAWLLAKTGEYSAASGIKYGALVGLAIVCTAMGTEMAFEARSLQSFLINAGYPLVGLMIMGAVIGAWKPKGAAAAQSA
jgi:hypothetical protein